MLRPGKVQGLLSVHPTTDQTGELSEKTLFPDVPHMLAIAGAHLLLQAGYKLIIGSFLYIITGLQGSWSLPALCAL